MKTTLDYSFKSDNDHIYKSNSSFQYLGNQDNELEFTQQFNRWNRVSSKGAIKHTVGFSAIWTDTYLDNNYWINTRYRHLLYDDWLYGKVIPEISFDKEYEYSANYSILFELEIFFAKKDTLKKFNYDH